MEVPDTVAHICNPCYPGGEDQENYSLRLAQGKSS
jgi:hypothetical protein